MKASSFIRREYHSLICRCFISFIYCCYNFVLLFLYRSSTAFYFLLRLQQGPRFTANRGRYDVQHTTGCSGWCTTIAATCNRSRRVMDTAVPYWKVEKGMYHAVHPPHPLREEQDRIVLTVYAHGPRQTWTVDTRERVTGTMNFP